MTDASEVQATNLLLATVALLKDVPEHGLTRGEVGTIVEGLDEATVLVEFSDDGGHAYAFASCPTRDLLVLRPTRRAV